MSRLQFNVYKVIDLVRTRPGMYIGTPSTNSMSVFIGGYEAAMRELEAEDVAAPAFRGFDAWVQKKLGYRESTAGWSNMILAHTLGLPPNHRWERNFELAASEEQHWASLQNFFELLGEYRGG